jgi:hypothetical protein
MSQATTAQNPPNPAPDPTATLVNTSALDFLLIELVPMAYRITQDLAAREEAWMHSSSNDNPAASRQQQQADNDATSTVGVSGAVSVSGAGGGAATVVDEEEAREAVFQRLEGLGYRVGLGVVER